MDRKSFFDNIISHDKHSDRLQSTVTHSHRNHISIRSDRHTSKNVNESSLVSIGHHDRSGELSRFGFGKLDVALRVKFNPGLLALAGEIKSKSSLAKTAALYQKLEESQKSVFLDAQNDNVKKMPTVMKRGILPDLQNQFAKSYFRNIKHKSTSRMRSLNHHISDIDPQTIDNYNSINDQAYVLESSDAHRSYRLLASKRDIIKTGGKVDIKDRLSLKMKQQIEIQMKKRFHNRGFVKDEMSNLDDIRSKLANQSQKRFIEHSEGSYIERINAYSFENNTVGFTLTDLQNKNLCLYQTVKHKEDINLDNSMIEILEVQVKNTKSTLHDLKPTSPENHKNKDPENRTFINLKSIPTFKNTQNPPIDPNRATPIFPDSPEPLKIPIPKPNPHRPTAPLTQQVMPAVTQGIYNCIVHTFKSSDRNDAADTSFYYSTPYFMHDIVAKCDRVVHYGFMLETVGMPSYGLLENCHNFFVEVLERAIGFSEVIRSETRLRKIIRKSILRLGEFMLIQPINILYTGLMLTLYCVYREKVVTANVGTLQCKFLDIPEFYLSSTMLSRFVQLEKKKIEDKYKTLPRKFFLVADPELLEGHGDPDAKFNSLVLAILNEKESKRKESIEKLKGKIESERVKRESEPFKSLNSHTEEDSKHTLKTQTSQGANKLKLQLQLIESDTKGMTNPGSMTVTALKRPIYPSLAFKISTLTTSGSLQTLKSHPLTPNHSINPSSLHNHLSTNPHLRPHIRLTTDNRLEYQACRPADIWLPIATQRCLGMTAAVLVGMISEPSIHTLTQAYRRSTCVREKAASC